MKETYSVRNWTPEKQTAGEFALKTCKRLLSRIVDAVAIEWLSDQYVTFRMHRMGGVGLRNTVLTPVLQSLAAVNLADFLSSCYKEVTLQCDMDTFITLTRKFPEYQCLVTFSIRTGGTFTNTHITFNVENAVFGDIVGTRKSHSIHGVSHTGGGWSSFDQQAFIHLFDVVKRSVDGSKAKLMMIEGIRKNVTNTTQSNNSSYENT